ncbi:4-(cytidine 5'-diphospho)-2-C-methyl-D-erythritol kinase [bacterium]|nr:MAG: 4-(cytidine 5'-diphospho)-2-C-methyl-D-erythritol kinase [bacterium]
METDGEAQLLALARRHAQLIFEGAEDAPAHELSQRRSHHVQPAVAGQLAALHARKQHLLAQRQHALARIAIAAPGARRTGHFVDGTDTPPVALRAHLGLRLAVETLADQQRPGKDPHAQGLIAAVVQHDVDDKRDPAPVLLAVRDEEGFGDLDALAHAKLRHLRVRKERELARDLTRKERALAFHAIGDLMGAEDDLVRVGVPEAAHVALGRARRERLVVSERRAKGDLRLGRHVGAIFVALGVVRVVHASVLSSVLYPKAPVPDRRTGLLVLLRAPAKLNLTLEVLDRLDDGYHRIRSVMSPIAIFDEIAVEGTAGAGGFDAVPANLNNASNLVVRAMRAAGVDGSALQVTLRKGIPVGAGLGGGSSDAAAVLAAVRDGRLAGAAPASWTQTARTLGSDVPFFLAGGPALVEATGERVTPAGSAPPWWALLAMPPQNVATAGAYELLDRARLQRPRKRGSRLESRSIRALEALQRADFAALAGLLDNDFQEAICAEYPAVAAAARALQAASGRPATLTGSGAALFTLFESWPEAQAAAARFDRSFGEVCVAQLTDDGSWR